LYLPEPTIWILYFRKTPNEKRAIRLTFTPRRSRYYDYGRLFLVMNRPKEPPISVLENIQHGKSLLFGYPGKETSRCLVRGDANGRDKLQAAFR
jgi:hypothetical protein